MRFNVTCPDLIYTHTHIQDLHFNKQFIITKRLHSFCKILGFIENYSFVFPPLLLCEGPGTDSCVTVSVVGLFAYCS